MAVHQVARGFQLAAGVAGAGGTHQNLRYAPSPLCITSRFIIIAPSLFVSLQATFMDNTTICCDYLSMAVSLPRRTTFSWGKSMLTQPAFLRTAPNPQHLSRSS